MNDHGVMDGEHGGMIAEDLRGSGEKTNHPTRPLTSSLVRSRHGSQLQWNLRALVIDATGVGAGLVSFLADRLAKGPRRVTVSPFLFI